MSHTRRPPASRLPWWRGLAPALVAVALAPHHAAAAPLGPAGDDFYAPPQALVSGPQGTVVWARPSTPITTPKGAGRATTVIYRSRAVDGTPNVVSGDVLVPPGPAPTGGWPIVAWDHVTTGAADRCAPTRTTASVTDEGRMVRSRTVASALLARGIAVVRTDYEGLGTPGRHPYLMGRPLAQSTVDMVRAARDLDPALASRYVVAGHSEGGVAALFTGALAKELAPELELRGVDAVAPVMSMRPLFELGKGLPFSVGVVTALAGLVLDGAATEEPALGSLYAQGGISAVALARYPDLDQRCLAELSKRDSWGGIPPSRILGPAGAGAYARFVTALDRNDPTRLTFPAGLPLRIDQGDLDPVTWRPLTDAFVRAQRRAGTSIAYRTYPLGNHANITDAGLAAQPVAAWAQAQLR